MADDETTPPGTPADSTDGLTRKERRTQGQGSKTWWWILGAVAALVVAVGIAAAVTAGHKATKAAPTTTTPPPVPTAPPPPCPLTGTPAPGGVVPGRPALAVKIGNYSGDRPSAGLNQADVVFEEPVEGAYTRLVAVFQCHGADLVGDMRSARQPDAASAGLLDELDDLAVDLAAEHHLDDLHRAVVGDAEAIDALAHDAHRGEHRVDLRALFRDGSR